ncbi:histone H1.0-like [Polypterus senegalus]
MSTAVATINQPKAKKARGGKTASSISNFEEMIKSAINNDKNQNGCTLQSIQKYIRNNYKVGNNADSKIILALKKLISAGTVLQGGGTSAAGLYKLKDVQTAKDMSKNVSTEEKSPRGARKKKAGRGKNVVRSRSKVRKNLSVEIMEVDKNKGGSSKRRMKGKGKRAKPARAPKHKAAKIGKRK